jgi:ATP-dependent helicase HepA
MNGTDLLNTFMQRGCLPHQAELAAAFFAPDSARIHVLVSAPGLGKGFVAGAIVDHALASGQARRILLLSPSGLLTQWLSTIQRWHPGVPLIVVDRRGLRELEASRGVGEDFWPARAVVLMSVDFAKQADVADLLTCASWDLLVVDELQVITPETTQVLVGLLGRCPKMRVLCLATGRVRADPGIDTSAEYLRGAAITVWSPENLRDNEGKPLLPEVRFEWIAHERNADEVAILTHLQDFLQTIKTWNPATRMIAVTLLEAASSSLFALEQRLERLLQRRNELVHGMARVSDTMAEAGDLDTMEPRPQNMSEEMRMLLELDGLTEPLLRMLGDVTTDSKCDALVGLLNTLEVEDSREGRVCLLTRFVDTATYLEIALRDHYSHVRVLTGSLELREREQIVADFARSGGVLIATEAVEGVLPEVASVVFYDLPLKPGVLEGRLGAFVRVGRHGPIRVFAFADETRTLGIERLQRQVAETKAAVGEDEIEHALFSKGIS